MFFHKLRVRTLALLMGWAFLPFAASASTRDHVIVITIDGLASYYLTDPKAPVPTLRRLAAEGATAKDMIVANPAITWPNHTTLVTGVTPAKHSVLFNGVLKRPGDGQAVVVDGAKTKQELVSVPTLYDHLHHAGYRTADINWPCTRGASTLDDSFPDVPEQITHMTPRLRDELIAAHWLAGTNELSFRDQSSAVKDQIWTAAAVHVIKERRPNLLLLHLLITDSTQHKYGPQSPAAYTAVALADAHVADVLRAVEAAGIRDRTTVIVTADHGFATALKIINPNVAFRKAGLQESTPTPTLSRARAQIVSEGGTAMVYFNNPDTAKDDRAKALELMRSQEGIAEILHPEAFAGLGYPDPQRNRQMADLVLVAKEGYAFNNESRGDQVLTDVSLANGNQGHHGYLSSNPRMNATFIAWGRGIKRGVKLETIRNVDVAPTVMKLFGRQLPDADGRVLSEILTGGPSTN